MYICQNYKKSFYKKSGQTFFVSARFLLLLPTFKANNICRIVS